MEKKISAGSSFVLMIVLVYLISFEKVVVVGLSSGPGLDDEKMCVDSYDAPCKDQGVGICWAECSNKYQSKLFNVYCEYHDNVSLCACVYRCTTIPPNPLLP